MNSWIYLFIAGISEIGWALSLKFSEGFSKPLMSIITLIFMIVSLVFLSFALKEIQIGTAYAIWTAIGAVGVAIVGMIFLGEVKSLVRIFCIMLIVAGIGVPIMLIYTYFVYRILLQPEALDHSFTADADVPD